MSLSSLNTILFAIWTLSEVFVLAFLTYKISIEIEYMVGVVKVSAVLALPDVVSAVRFTIEDIGSEVLRILGVNVARWISTFDFLLEGKG